MELACNEVEVHELSLNEIWELESKYELVNYISDTEPGSPADGIINAIRNYNPQRIFRVAWKGSRVPRGVVVAGYSIEWTQNGVVNFRDNDYFGTYDRLVDRGGEEGDEHLMLIYLDPTTF